MAQSAKYKILRIFSLIYILKIIIIFFSSAFRCEYGDRLSPDLLTAKRTVSKDKDRDFYGWEITIVWPVVINHCQIHFPWNGTDISQVKSTL